MKSGTTPTPQRKLLKLFLQHFSQDALHPSYSYISLGFRNLSSLKVGMRWLLSLNPPQYLLSYMLGTSSTNVFFFQMKYNRNLLQGRKLELGRLPMTMKQNTQRLYNMLIKGTSFGAVVLPGFNSCLCHLLAM